MANAVSARMLIEHPQRGVAMRPVLELPIDPARRQAALDNAVSERAAEGWALEQHDDYERVLVGHNQFRRLLLKRRGPLKRRELVEVDKRGEITITRV